MVLSNGVELLQKQENSRRLKLAELQTTPAVEVENVAIATPVINTPVPKTSKRSSFLDQDFAPAAANSAVSPPTPEDTMRVSNRLILTQEIGRYRLEPRLKFVEDATVNVRKFSQILCFGGKLGLPIIPTYQH